MRRRSLLSSLAAAGVATIAGCYGEADDPAERTPADYDLLATQDVHVASGVSLTLPKDVPTVEDPGSADLVVLPGSADVTPETGIDWLASGTGVALVGEGGQSTLLGWLESDAYGERFESRGFGRGSPPPDFLVAFGVDGQYVSNHGFTWNDTDDPSNGRYLSALEQALEDVGGE